MADLNIITTILEALKEGSKAYYAWQVGREKARLEACKDAAEKFIQICDGDGEYADLEEKEKKRLLKHFRRRFFSYN